MIRIPPLPRLDFLFPGAVLAAALAAGCAPSTAAPAADPSTPGTQQPTFGASDMPPGTRVKVAKEGQWYGATIVQPLGEGRFLVHYDNTGNEWNEAVGPDRIRRFGPSAAPPRARPATTAPGEKVLVTYQNRLLLADVVMAVGADSWRVHYEGFGPEAAENVGPARLKRPFSGQSGHNPGESVMVEVKGQTLAAKVLAASAADRWVVRFEKYGPEYDQEVGVDRLKAAAPVVAPPVEPKPAEKPPEKAAEKPPEKVAEKPEKPAEKVAETPAEKPKPKAPPVEAAPAAQAGPPAVGENVLVNVRGRVVRGLGHRGGHRHGQGQVRGGRRRRGGGRSHPPRARPRQGPALPAGSARPRRVQGRLRALQGAQGGGQGRVQGALRRSGAGGRRGHHLQAATTPLSAWTAARAAISSVGGGGLVP